MYVVLRSTSLNEFHFLLLADPPDNLNQGQNDVFPQSGFEASRRPDDVQLNREDCMSPFSVCHGTILPQARNKNVLKQNVRVEHS